MKIMFTPQYFDTLITLINNFLYRVEPSQTLVNYFAKVFDVVGMFDKVIMNSNICIATSFKDESYKGFYETSASVFFHCQY